QRLHGDLEVRSVGGPHDRNVRAGAARYPGQRHVAGAHATARGNLAHAPRDLAIDVVAVVLLVKVVRGARRRPGAGEKAARQWTECRDRDALVAAVGKHLTLLLAVEQVVLALHIDE